MQRSWTRIRRYTKLSSLLNPFTFTGVDGNHPNSFCLNSDSSHCSLDGYRAYNYKVEDDVFTNRRLVIVSRPLFQDFGLFKSPQ